jgi:hypothetical protein
MTETSAIILSYPKAKNEAGIRQNPLETKVATVGGNYIQV